MDDDKGVVLPYRTTGEEVTRFLEARARGRDLGQIQALDFSTGAFQGTLVAATVLGFLDADARDLTQLGRDYVLGSAAERTALMRAAVQRFEPYGLLLEAVFDRGAAQETPLDWVVTWWSTQGYGNSETNRAEGASSFARFVEFTGLGSFIPGRRGHPTRIRWADSAPGKVKGPTRQPPVTVRKPIVPDDSARHSPTAGPVQAEAAPPAAAPETPLSAAEPAAARPATQRTWVEPREPEPNTSLVLSLGPGRTVQLTVPPRITATEKQRLLGLMELMITTAPDE